MQRDIQAEIWEFPGRLAPQCYQPPLDPSSLCFISLCSPHSQLSSTQRRSPHCRDERFPLFCTSCPIIPRPASVRGPTDSNPLHQKSIALSITAPVSPSSKQHSGLCELRGYPQQLFTGSPKSTDRFLFICFREDP